MPTVYCIKLSSYGLTNAVALGSQFTMKVFSVSVLLTLILPNQGNPTLDGPADLDHLPTLSFDVRDGHTFNVYKENELHCSDVQLNEVAVNSRSTFDPRNPTYVTIHGWYGSRAVEVNRNVGKALHIKNREINQIVVEWTQRSDAIYLLAASRVPEVGRAIGEMLENLSRDTGLALANVTLIGYSLGAHVAGFAGKYLNGSLGGIIGLDPARLWFNDNLPGDRLDKGDAKYVQVVHTDSQGIHPFGIDKPIGHADFYFNYGHHQPGCGVFDFICSHKRSHEYFVESLTSKEGYTAKKCRDYEEIKEENCDSKGEVVYVLGGEVDRVEGVFYIETNSKGGLELKSVNLFIALVVIIIY